MKLAPPMAAAMALASPAAAVVISFSDPQPTALVNVPVSLGISIDYGSSGSMALFSYGVVITGDWDASGVVPLGVEVPPELDFNGVAGPGALIGLGNEFMGAKGTVNISASPFELYPGPEIAGFRFLFPQPGTYEFQLGFFNTLGPTEDIFVNQEGVSIDDLIEFRSGIVQVIIPEPRISTLILATAASLLMRRGRSHPAAASGHGTAPATRKDKKAGVAR